MSKDSFRKSQKKQRVSVKHKTVADNLEKYKTNKHKESVKQSVS